MMKLQNGIETAAEQGDQEAWYKLENMYYRGEGVKKDTAEAAKWYQKAAEQGHEEARRLLAFCRCPV